MKLEELKAIAMARHSQDKLDVLKYSPEEAAAEMVRGTFAKANFYEMCDANIDRLIAVAEAVDHMVNTYWMGKVFVNDNPASVAQADLVAALAALEKK